MNANASSIFRFDAVTCAATGALLAAAATPLDRVLDTGRPAILRAVGVALLAYAPVLVLLARARDDVRARGLAVTGLGDAAWVLGTVALVAMGAFSAAGAGLALASAAVVGAIGVAKALHLRAA